MAKILIVEDEQATDGSMKDSLQGLGHTVVASVASGTAAIEWVTSAQPDVVLMDVRVPELTDGFLAVEEISSQLNIPIVYWTPYVDCLPRQPSIQSEPLGGLSKPCQTHELYAAIEIALLRHQFEQRFAQIEQAIATLLEPSDLTSALPKIGGVLDRSKQQSEHLSINPLTLVQNPEWNIAQNTEQNVKQAVSTNTRINDCEYEFAILDGTDPPQGINVTQKAGQACDDQTSDRQALDRQALDRQALDSRALDSQNWQRDRQQTEILFRQQTERGLFLHSIAQRIQRSLRLEEILYTTVTEIRQFLQSDRVFVYRLPPNARGSVIIESIAYGLHPMLGQSLIETTSVESSWHQAFAPYNDPLSISNTRQIIPVSSIHAELLRAFPAIAQIVVPLLQNHQPNHQPDTQLWGLLVVQQCDRARAWQSDEVTLLKQLSTQVAIAIQQAELHEKIQYLNAQLDQQVHERTAQFQQALDFEALLKRITDKVRDSLDECQILQTAVQELAIELKTHSCDTGLYDLAQQTSTVTHEFIRSEQVPSAIAKTISMSVHPEVYQSLLQGKTLQFCWQAVPIDIAVRQFQSSLTALVCPLMDQGEVIGDLWLYKSSQEIFDAATIRLVQQVASQCAIAIRQARLYKASQAQVLELERLNYLKDDFLNTISHELRTPVASIRMASQMLEIRLRQAGMLDASPDHVGKYLQILQDECDREINLINNILDLSRLDAQIEPITPFPIQLQNWIPHLLEPFLDRIQQQQQRLSIDIPEHLPPVQSDLSSLGKILTELINNACKYTPAEAEIRIITQIIDDRHIQIQVSNSGVELSNHDQAQIFEKFYRIPNWDPWRQGGTGLGLALVKRLVAHVGGSIAVTSANNWTTFTVELPC